MLSALTRFFRRSRDEAQLELVLPERPLAALRTADDLLARLRELGLSRITRCRLTRNRSVMVSFADSLLRVHEGYLGAPTEIHRAIVQFVEGRTRAERRAAQERIVAYPAVAEAPAPASLRRERTHPDDQEIVERLSEWHARYNAMHFDHRLRSIPIRVSRRMKSRLGHYSAASPHGGDPEIAMSRTHLRRHGWDEMLHTLLHEMVHQWQDECGHPLDHGRAFRMKARAVGIVPSAGRHAARAG